MPRFWSVPLARWSRRAFYLSSCLFYLLIFFFFSLSLWHRSEEEQTESLSYLRPVRKMLTQAISAINARQHNFGATFSVEGAVEISIGCAKETLSGSALFLAERGELRAVRI